jgi:biopolymer transport protein ExbD
MGAVVLICANILTHIVFLYIMMVGTYLRYSLRPEAGTVPVLQWIRHDVTELEIAVLSDGRYTFGDAPIDLERLSALLKVMARRKATLLNVTIAANKRAPFGAITDAMEAANHAGVSAVTFTVSAAVP